MIKNYLTSLKQEFSGYNTAKLMKDIMAGLTVCAVALPLALAFGVSSGATAAAGLVTAIIAGVVIAVLGGASFQISGPTGAMSAVLVGIVASYGLQGVFFACFAAGALLLLAGIFKLGRRGSGQNRFKLWHLLKWYFPLQSLQKAAAFFFVFKKGRQRVYLLKSRFKPL